MNHQGGVGQGENQGAGNREQGTEKAGLDANDTDSEIAGRDAENPG